MTDLTLELDEERTQWHIDYINRMSHFDMARARRFYPSGHIYFNVQFPQLVKAFDKRWKAFGGMTVEMSKKIGWDR